MSLPHKTLIVFLLKMLVFIPGITAAQTNSERIESDRNDENGFLSILMQERFWQMVRPEYCG